MPPSRIWPIELAHNSVGAHYGLIFYHVHPFVPREVRLLVPFRAAYGASRAINEAPTVGQRPTLVVDSLEEKKQTKIYRVFLYDFVVINSNIF